MSHSQCCVVKRATDGDEISAEFMVGKIEFYLLKSALNNERGDRVIYGMKAQSSETRGHANRRGFTNTDVVIPARARLCERLKNAVTDIADQYDEIFVLPTDVKHRLRKLLSHRFPCHANTSMMCAYSSSFGVR